MEFEHKFLSISLAVAVYQHFVYLYDITAGSLPFFQIFRVGSWDEVTNNSLMVVWLQLQVSIL